MTEQAPPAPATDLPPGTPAPGVDPDPLAVPQTVPVPPHDLTATLCGGLEECWRQVRLKRSLPSAPDTAQQALGVVVHAALEVAARKCMGEEPMIASRRVDKRAMRKIVDELLARRVCQPQHHEVALEHLAQLTPVDFTHTWGVEVPFELTLDDGVPTRLAGKIDRVDLIHERGELRQVVAYDYKIGKAKERDYLRRCAQTAVYLPALRAEWPDERVRIVLRYVYLRFGEEVTVDWSRELEAWARGHLASVAALWHRGYDRAVTGAHCGKCSVQGGCPEGTAYLQRALKRTKTLDAWHDHEALAGEFREVTQQVSALKSYRKRLADTLMALLDPATGKLTAGKWAAKRRHRQKTVYEPGCLGPVARALALDQAQAGHQGVDLELLVRRTCAVRTGKIREAVSDAPTAKAVLERYQGLDRSEWVVVEKARTL